MDSDVAAKFGGNLGDGLSCCCWNRPWAICAALVVFEKLVCSLTNKAPNVVAPAKPDPAMILYAAKYAFLVSKPGLFLGVNWSYCLSCRKSRHDRIPIRDSCKCDKFLPVIPSKFVVFV